MGVKPGLSHQGMNQIGGGWEQGAEDNIWK
jgi:hypothetical protein